MNPFSLANFRFWKVLDLHTLRSTILNLKEIKNYAFHDASNAAL